MLARVHSLSAGIDNAHRKLNIRALQRHFPAAVLLCGSSALRRSPSTLISFATSLGNMVSTIGHWPAIRSIMAGLIR